MRLRKLALVMFVAVAAGHAAVFEILDLDQLAEESSAVVHARIGVEQRAHLHSHRLYSARGALLEGFFGRHL